MRMTLDALPNAPAALAAQPVPPPLVLTCADSMTMRSILGDILSGGGAGSESPSDGIIRCVRCSIPVWHRFSAQRPAALEPNLSTRRGPIQSGHLVLTCAPIADPFYASLRAH